MSHGFGPALAAKRRFVQPFEPTAVTEAAQASGTGAFTVASPGGFQVGWRLFIYAHKPTATAALTAPASPAFTVVAANAAGSDRAHLYTRIADAADVAAATFNGPSRDVSTALLVFCWAVPPCTIEDASDLAATGATTIVGDDFPTGTDPSAAAKILACGGTNDTVSIPYTPTATPTLELLAENSTTGVSGFVCMSDGFVTTAPGTSDWQGADRASAVSAQKGAIVCYLVPS